MDNFRLCKPTLIIGAGNSATGKTTHLIEIAKALDNSFWIDKDTINDTMLRRMDHSSKCVERYLSNNGTLPRKCEHHMENVQLQSYLLMLEEAKNNLSLGKHPIIDGNYISQLQEGYYDKVIIPFFREVPCRIKVIYFYAPEDVVKQRMIKRNARRDDDKLKSDDAWKEFLRREPILIESIDSVPHIKVDSTRPLQENLLVIADFIKEDS